MSDLPKIVVLSGAGISAESGLLTFRDSGGLWEGYNVEQVASIDGWYENPKLVLDFYNMRRKQAFDAVPNQGHTSIAELEQFFDVHVITQNVDDLHEKAGSTKVLHLHGKLREVKSEHDDSYIDDSYIIDIRDGEINVGDLCPNGHQLRPNIVWFGEMVPAIEQAAKIVSTADVLIVVGTSLVVYPAAGLVDYVPNGAKIYLVDPNPPIHLQKSSFVTCFAESASTGMQKIKQSLLKEFNING